MKLSNWPTTPRSTLFNSTFNLHWNYLLSIKKLYSLTQKNLKTKLNRIYEIGQTNLVYQLTFKTKCSTCTATIIPWMMMELLPKTQKTSNLLVGFLGITHPIPWSITIYWPPPTFPESSLKSGTCKGGAETDAKNI